MRKVDCELPWIKLDERRRLHTLTFFFKIHNKIIPSSLYETLNKFKRINIHNTRSNNDYKLPIVHHHIVANSFLLRGMKLWNCLDNSSRDLSQIQK
jgi:hypothetical protein